MNDSGIKEFQKAIATFKNWQKEIFSSFAFDLHNDYIEGINNQTKVIKCDINVKLSMYNFTYIKMYKFVGFDLLYVWLKPNI